MDSLLELITIDEIIRLSLPSNFKYGKAIYDQGAVIIIRNELLEAEAWVGGLPGKVIDGAGSRRRTLLFATPQGLAWHCAGNPKNHNIFCKHCVALALALLDQK